MSKIIHRPTRIKRKLRVSGRIFGTADRPRLSIYRSQKHIYLQVIDDQKGETLAASNELQLRKTQKLSGTKTERAAAVAEDLVKKLKSKKINRLAFDRGHYRYHGRVKKIAEVLRAAGVEV